MFSRVKIFWRIPTVFSSLKSALTCARCAAASSSPTVRSSTTLTRSTTTSSIQKCWKWWNKGSEQNGQATLPPWKDRVPRLPSARNQVSGCCVYTTKYSGDLNADHLNTGNIWILSSLKFGFQMVWYSNGWFLNCMHKAVTSARLSWSSGLKKQTYITMASICQVFKWPGYQVFKWHLNIRPFGI